MFESEEQLLTSHDLSLVPATDQDDGFAVYSQRALATVADEGDNDRTHKTTIDGHLHVEYSAPSGAVNLSVPVGHRVTSDERREVFIRVHVFNEPFDDVGYDADGNPTTPAIGGSNGVFDWMDVNGNGVHDSVEPSEPFVEISGDNPPVRNTVLGSASAAASRLAEEFSRSTAGWAQALVQPVQVGGISIEDAPLDAAGVNILRDGTFSIGPGVDEESVLVSAVGTVPHIVEVYFVSPFVQASMAEGLASTPGLRGGITLPVGQQEDTYLFVASSAHVRRRVLAHELGHALTNLSDSPTPAYVYFPSLDGSSHDDNVDRQRRVSHKTEEEARACRAAGNLQGIGNRLLTGCP